MTEKERLKGGKVRYRMRRKEGKRKAENEGGEERWNKEGTEEAQERR